MRVLIIKTSSMGDVIHTLPALTDACRANPEIKFDWVIEENFAAIAKMHPAVNKIIPLALRRWRKNLFSRVTYREVLKFKQEIGAENYDIVIDAQGLIKSSIVSCLAKGKRVGLNRKCVRETLASWFYHKTYNVPRNEHAIVRTRKLLSLALNYKFDASKCDYGIDAENNQQKKYLIFLPNTSWENKMWPIPYWRELSSYAAESNLPVKIAWGNRKEQQIAEKIAEDTHAEVLPDLNITGVSSVMKNALAVVTVDTGFGHLAAALNIPTVAIFGPTDPKLSGVLGKQTLNMAAEFACAPCLNRQCKFNYDQDANDSPLNPPCFQSLTPLSVWNALRGLLGS